MRLPSTLVAAQRLLGHAIADNKLAKGKLSGDFSYFNVGEAIALDVSMWLHLLRQSAVKSWVASVSSHRQVKSLIISLSHFLPA